ncbi:MAG: FAD-dependent oxidoreductase [Elusimicrobia bacterium]|nr:FAD-dependent oxidoreductase [Elusimicrobiota bacterium]
MPALGDPSNPLRVAVVGAGPSGFYAAEAILKQKDLAVRVDLFERLPTPYGLVRGGVAPDHQKIKSVALVYDKIAGLPGFRFFGNVKLGQDISAADLAARYHQIVYAFGNESDRKMGIPGEDLAGSRSATEFVGWYNAHPDFRDRQFDLSCESAVIVGLGNVAMDVARILAQDPQNLRSTDIAGYALDALLKSRIKTIYLLGRRGPAEAAYSPQEIRDLGELSSADLVVKPEEALVAEASKPLLADPAARKNADYALEKSRAGEGAKSKKIRLRFCVSPIEITGENGRAKAVKVEKNRLVPDGRGGAKLEKTGRFETLPAGLVLRAIGYRGVPIPGVPFDEKAGKTPNAEGRVLDAQGKSLVGHYAVGWTKRGPSGLIGTNRADSAATVKLMLSDARAGQALKPAQDAETIGDFLRQKGARPVSFADWKALDALEKERGKASGKVREKFSSAREMLSALEAKACK